MGPLPRDFTATCRTAIYLRVSIDRRKRRSVTQQGNECATELTKLGIDPDTATVYDDNDKSASGYSRKLRDAWAALVADLDQINLIIMWESSRGGREDLEWTQFLRNCRSRGVLIHVVKDHRTYDVRNRLDYKDLAKQGIDNADYSAELSERIQRDKQWIRDEGLPDGQAAFGWTRDYDPKTRELIAQRPVPEQIPVVKSVLHRIVEGFAITQISRELGLTRNMVRRIALNPIHIGRRYKPGTTELDSRPGNWGVLYPGVEDMWWQARRILTDPARKTTKPGKGKHLASYIAISGCGHPLGVMTRQGSPYYICSADQCVGVKRDWLDAYLKKLMVDRFTEPDLWNEAIKHDDADVLAAHAEAAELRELLDGMWRQVKAGKLPLARYTDADAELTSQIEAADQRGKEAGLPPQLRTLARIVLDHEQRVAKKLISEALESMPVSGLRDVLRLLFAEIRVDPSREGPRGGRQAKLDKSRIHYVWRTDWT
jgi:DNA invertase Pin-like site-specific DNA recombinase